MDMNRHSRKPMKSTTAYEGSVPTYQKITILPDKDASEEKRNEYAWKMSVHRT